jgi:uncharacterized protein YutE (UPF0331/DUF86 family)
VERISQKISKIKEYVKYIEDLGKECHQKFKIDPVYRGALLYYLYLMADTCIAVAEMIIKRRELRAPQSYSDAFDILGDNNILEKEFAYSFARIAGFRNLLAHDYEIVDAQIICQDILKKIPDVKKFLHQVQQSMNL